MLQICIFTPIIKLINFKIYNFNRFYLFILLIFIYLHYCNINDNVDTIYNTALNLLLNTNTNLLFLLLFYYILYNNIYKIIPLFIFHFIFFNLPLDTQINDINDYTNYEFKINTNLLNGLFLIHPLLIYLFLISLFFLYSLIFKYIYLLNFFPFYIENYLYIFKKNTKIIYFLCSLISSAIILGSWWAMQELNWGTWWNWDLVEIINLLYFIIILKTIHDSILINIKQYFKSLNLIAIFILCTLTVRYNLIQSIHNFINANDFNQFLKYCVIVLYSTIFYYIINVIFKIKKYNFIFKCDLTKYAYMSIIQFLLILIFYSYLKFKNNLIILSFINIWFISLILFSFIFLYNKKFTNKVYYLFYIFFYENSTVLNLFKIYQSIKIFKFIHFAVLLFLLIILFKNININKIIIFYININTQDINKINYFLDFNLFSDYKIINNISNQFISTKKFNQSFNNLLLFSDEFLFQETKIINSILKWSELNEFFVLNHNIYKINLFLFMLLSIILKILFLKKIRKII